MSSDHATSTNSRTRGWTNNTPGISVNPIDESEWDNNLRQFPKAQFFHSSAWARVLNETYGFKPRYLRGGAQEQAPWIIPAMEASSWLTRSRGVTLPFTDECSALQSDPQPLREHVLKSSCAESWRTWEYRGGLASVPEAEGKASESFFGHRLELSTDTDALFAKFDGKARTSVRKAVQQDVVVELSTSLDATKQFYGQLCHTRRRHGLPPQPWSFFEAIHRNVLSKGLGFVAIATHGAIPIASAIFFHFGSNAIYKFAASNHRYRHLQANHLVIWHAIQWYAKNRYRSFDFGRTSKDNEGLRHFKLAWRPGEYSIDYVKYDLQRRCFLAGQKQLTTGWHNRVFRLLPLPISRAIGAMAYRHMA